MSSEEDRLRSEIGRLREREEELIQQCERHLSILRRWAIDMVPEINTGTGDDALVQQFEDLLALAADKEINARAIHASVAPARARLHQLRRQKAEQDFYKQLESITKP